MENMWLLTTDSSLTSSHMFGSTTMQAFFRKGAVAENAKRDDSLLKIVTAVEKVVQRVVGAVPKIPDTHAEFIALRGVRLDKGATPENIKNLGRDLTYLQAIAGDTVDACRVVGMIVTVVNTEFQAIDEAELKNRLEEIADEGGDIVWPIADGLDDWPAMGALSTPFRLLFLLQARNCLLLSEVLLRPMGALCANAGVFTSVFGTLARKSSTHQTAAGDHIPIVEQYDMRVLLPLLADVKEYAGTLCEQAQLKVKSSVVVEQNV